MDKLVNTEFIDSPKYLWSVDVLSLFLKFIDDLKKSDGEEVHERSFEVFAVRMNQAISEFLRDMAGLGLIMNCRTKGNSDSNFGGHECANFMDKIIEICNEYLAGSQFLSGNEEGDLGYVIRGIKDKARRDRVHAMDFEKSARNLYLAQGIDKTEDIFKDAGYFDTQSNIKTIADLKNSNNILKSNIM